MTEVFIESLSTGEPMNDWIKGIVLKRISDVPPLQKGASIHCLLLEAS
jgi:hypothetical protein